MKQPLKILAPIAILGILIITLFSIKQVVVSPEPQQTRIKTKAGPPINDVLVAFSVPSTLYVGQEYAIPLTINTQGTEVAAVQFQISFDSQAITPLTDILEPSLSTVFHYPYNSIAAGVIQVAAYLHEADGPPFISTSPENFAIFRFRAERAGATSLSFDPTISAVFPKASSQNVLVAQDALLKIIVDDLAPAPFSLLSPNHNSWATSNRPTFSWQSSTDSETGLAKYQLFINGSLAVDNIPSDQTNKQAPSSLPNGSSNIWHIVAWDRAGNQRRSGETWTVKIDTTPPSIPIVTDAGETTDNNVQLEASWSAYDSESGIQQYYYRINRDTPSGTAIVNWTSAGTNTSVIHTGLNLEYGYVYYFSVRATNRAGLSQIGSSDGIEVLVPTPTLSFQISFEGIISQGKNKDVRVTFRDAVPNDTRFQNVTLTSNAQGIYSPLTPLALSGINPGNYTILIKGPAHLQKNLGTFTIDHGSNNFDWSSVELLAGDITGHGEGTPPDNKVDGADYSIFSGLFDPFNPAPEGTLADFNDNDVVDGGDYSLLSGNFDPFGGGDE